MIVVVIVCMVKIMISETMVVIAPVNGNISHNNTISSKFYKLRQTKYNCDLAGYKDDRHSCDQC